MMSHIRFNIRFFFFFFFSSRRRHTRLVSDWSSDVCSSVFCAMIVSVPCPCSVTPVAATMAPQIGRASGRERVWKSVGGGSVKKKRKRKVVSDKGKLDSEIRYNTAGDHTSVWAYKELSIQTR